MDIHGSEGFTTIPRVVAIVTLTGFLAIGLHLGLQAIYAGRILPGVAAGGQNLGGKSLADARRILKREADNYRLELKVSGKDFVLKPSDIGVTYDPEATLNAAYNLGRSDWLLPLHTAPIALSYNLDRHQAAELAATIASEIGVPPVDAGVVIVNGKVSTEPEQSGVTVDKVGLLKLIERDIASPSGAVIPVEPRTVAADIQAAALGTNVNEAKQLMATPIVLTYNDQNFTPTAADIGQWISFEKVNQDSSPILVTRIDSSKLKSYIQQIANKLNVAPVSKQITIENGVSKVTQEGVDGLAIDQDVLVSAVSAAVLAHKPLTQAMTAHAVPFKTTSTSVISLDYGQYIEINLSKQHLWVWQDHNVIYESPITSGATGAGFPTVTGLFSIYYKTTNTHLVGYQYGPRYNYDVAVKYWMPFYQGYGLHDASWRNGIFGGPDYYYGGSHGCVNLPDATAAFIYGWSSIGTPVWVHN